MRRVAIRSREMRPLVALALALVVFMSTLEGAVGRHLHADDGPGLYNAECSLVLLARLTASAPVPDTLPAICRVVVAAPVVAVATSVPESAPARHADPRAPPR